MATTIALALVFVAGNASRAVPDAFVFAAQFVDALAVMLVFGVVLWGPIALVALIPGWWVFNRIRRAIRGGWLRNLIGTALASLAVAAMGAVLGPILLALLANGKERIEEVLPIALMLFPFGAPAAIVSGFLFYGREDRRDV